LALLGRQRHPNSYRSVLKVLNLEGAFLPSSQRIGKGKGKVVPVLN